MIVSPAARERQILVHLAGRRGKRRRLSLASAQTMSADASFGEHASLRLTRATLRAQEASPALVEKLGSNTYRYFRLLARQFAARTCHEFRDLRWRLPVTVDDDARISRDFPFRTADQ